MEFKRAKSYSEAVFEGDSLLVDGNSLEWSALSLSVRQALLNSIYHEEKVLEGKVDFSFAQVAYDLRGGTKGTLWEQETRGVIRDALTDVFPSNEAVGKEAAAD